jgi:hypothetical protein
MNCCRNSKPQSKAGDWQTERQTALQRICERIELQVSQGGKVRPLCRRAAKRLRKVALSGGRLATLFYLWRSNGRTPQTFALNWNPANRRPVSRAQIARFVRQAKQPGIFTFAAAFAGMQQSSKPVQFSPTHFFRSLPAALSKELRGLFYQRRKLRGVEGRFLRAIRKGDFAR